MPILSWLFFNENTSMEYYKTKLIYVKFLLTLIKILTCTASWCIIIAERNIIFLNFSDLLHFQSRIRISTYVQGGR